MPSCEYEKDYRALEARRGALRRKFIAKGVMDGTHKMDNLIRRNMRM